MSKEVTDAERASLIKDVQSDVNEFVEVCLRGGWPRLKYWLRSYPHPYTPDDFAWKHAIYKLYKYFAECFGEFFYHTDPEGASEFHQRIEGMLEELNQGFTTEERDKWTKHPGFFRKAYYHEEKKFAYPNFETMMYKPWMLTKETMAKFLQERWIEYHPAPSSSSSSPP
jgi:hypothetical protein